LVKIGNLSTGGKARTLEAKEADDHDTEWQARLVPFGILSTSNDQLSIYMGQSAETSNFIVDYLTAWWHENQPQKSQLDEWVINLDGGAATRSDRTQFIKRMVELSQSIGVQIPAQTLLLLDRGFYHFLCWQQLSEQGIHFLNRLKKGAKIRVQEVFTDSYTLRDRRIEIGSGTKKTPCLTLRLVEVRSGQVWHSYLTSLLDPEVLPPYVVADLYRKRWRIEDAFNTVKRLLGLSYLWTGSLNGIQLQIWGTWLFYSVLLDLGDQG